MTNRHFHIKLPEWLMLGGLVLLMLLLLNRTSSKPDQAMDRAKDKDQPALPEEPVNLLYGINMDGRAVEEGRVGRNEFLADILLDHGVDYWKIDRLARMSKDYFDVRKMRAGNPYAIISRVDSVKQVEYFAYEIDNTQYLVADLRDSVSLYRGEKAVDTLFRHIAGSISTSLWDALNGQGANPFLAVLLSEIYAWEIDFFGLQKQDSFAAYYEELFVDGKSIGLGRVHAALFHHADHDYYAYYFVQDSVGDYFDEEGGSLRRTFLKAPLRYSRISSRYSNSRLHPILKIRRPHHGVDYAAPTGTPVHAIGDGVVTLAKWKGGGGNTVKIKHNGTYTTAYLHLSRYARGIKAGAHVKQGDVIGYVGSTGLSTGPHLDFRFYKNGQAIDPLKVESPPAEPVDSTHLQRFVRHADSCRSLLEKPNLLAD